MSIQSSVNRIIGSVESGFSGIRTGIERGEGTELLKKQIGLQKQQIWSQKGQIARMKKANERIKERQEVLKAQKGEIDKKLKVSIGGTELSPSHPLYQTLIGGKDGTTK